jgi:hypothetical protein
MYDVPAEIHPHKNALINEYSNVNSSVYPFITHKNTPTQKPIQRGQ